MSELDQSWTTLKTWFPRLTDDSWKQLKKYTGLLRDWNSKINLVSRKDTERLETKHLAHCLTITHFLRLMQSQKFLMLVLEEDYQEFHSLYAILMHGSH